jgi:broad specificity phosphatase PhoE
VVTRILLIRHASTDPRGRLCGSFDVPLSVSGRAEVQALVKRLDRRCAGVDALYTSTLRRARQVAVALGRLWDMPPQGAEWAREIHCGHVEGQLLDQVQRDFPALWARNNAQEDESFAWPGGETYAQFRTRVLDGLEATATGRAGQRVAVVTHAGVISQVMGLIRGRVASRWSVDRPDPLTATEIAWENGAPSTVLTYNERDWY